MQLSAAASSRSFGFPSCSSSFPYQGMKSLQFPQLPKPQSASILSSHSPFLWGEKCPLGPLGNVDALKFLGNVNLLGNITLLLEIDLPAASLSGEVGFWSC